MSEVKKTVLYDRHLRLTDKSRMAEFAGYEMPLWYSSIAEEHAAVREAAGLFDCTHMGVIEVAGAGAEAFLNYATTNDVKALKVGQAQYSYALDGDGGVLDDLIVYLRGADKFMVVANASNEAKVRGHLAGLAEGECAGMDVTLRDLRDERFGAECLVDLALQGPSSMEILAGLMNAEEAERLGQLGSFCFMEGRVGDIAVLVSRTGYTGAKVGYELFVAPGDAGRLWDMLLERGGAMGLRPCGLGARDSLRIEAGLPLYGHELAGEFDISPFEAGYGWAVKLDKGEFLGREAMVERCDSYDMQVVRLAAAGRAGVRPVRGGDGVLSAEGVCVGQVLSGAKAGERQILLAYVQCGTVKKGDEVGLYYLARNAKHVQQGRLEKVTLGDELSSDLAGEVLRRFGGESH
ncbi:MAG: glycine cleavage system aminomethyltransferase GcvT [Sedimentisphaerales bacterium]|nr:glycine cleavage system aminomethyltransferase GcvT [Sedimentisphaerales bacterium]